MALRTTLASRRQAVDEAEQWRELSELKTRFLNMAAHELNTPLTPMRLQLHLIKSGVLGPLNARQANGLRILERNLERLHGLVQEILDVARIEGGGLRTTPEVFALDEAVLEALDAFGETASRVGVTLSPPAASGLHVEADRNRLLQVLYNLLSNAIKFTPAPGTVRVTVASDDGHVVIQVQDSGVGMAPEQLEQLFKPFARLHEATHPSAGGTGLGLFIAKGITEAMQGTLTATSAGPGTGTTFVLRLPTVAATADVKAAPEEGEDAIAKRLREII